MKEEVMLKFAKLWKEANLSGLMDMFTDDAVYKPSIPLEGKSIFKGKEEISTAIRMILDHDNSIHSQVSNIVLNNNFGFWEWEYITANGENLCGCDVFEFRGDKIFEKNAFRKINL